MRGIIWYQNFATGLNKFENLIQDYKRINIEMIKTVSCKHNQTAYFSNGDIWELVCANENSRGKSCNIGLFEYGLPEELINTVLMPCIKSYPYQAYNFYG